MNKIIFSVYFICVVMPLQAMNNDNDDDQPRVGSRRQDLVFWSFSLPQNILEDWHPYELLPAPRAHVPMRGELPVMWMSHLRQVPPSHLMAELISCYHCLWIQTHGQTCPHPQYWSNLISPHPSRDELQYEILHLTALGWDRARNVLHNLQAPGNVPAGHVWSDFLEYSRQAFYLLLLGLRGGLFDETIARDVPELFELLVNLNILRDARGSVRLSSEISNPHSRFTGPVSGGRLGQIPVMTLSYRDQAMELVRIFLPVSERDLLSAQLSWTTMLAMVQVSNPQMIALALGIRQSPPERYFDREAIHIPFVLHTQGPILRLVYSAQVPPEIYYYYGTGDPIGETQTTNIFATLTTPQETNLSALLPGLDLDAFEWFPVPAIFAAVTLINLSEPSSVLHLNDNGQHNQYGQTADISINWGQLRERLGCHFSI